jgi:hypothetical protein
MNRRISTVCLAIAVLAAGCGGSSAMAPSSNAASLLGTWLSVSAASSTAGSCANFQWTVTDISGLTGSGSFSATCFGTLQVTGTGSGTLTANAIDWKVTGTATGSGQGTCNVSATGSARLTSDGSLEIPYSGTTCLGSVNGTQIIKRQ